MSITEEMIFPADIVEEVQKSFLDYSVSVITDRALPDVRDGNKPVHRRILYAMHMAKSHSHKPHVKSAEIVGNVLGSLHPHGDSSVYDAMVRLTQDFALNVPLVDGHGNYGNIDGDPAAHYRYSQARLSKAGEMMLLGLDEGTVDWKDNFSESQLEPVVLPSRLPNLLVNGSTGIAVGMAASFAPGNLKQVVESIKATLKNPKISHESLLEISGGPDFPTGGVVINKEELLKAYKEGRGRARIRAEYKIRKNKGSESLVFYSIPYSVRKSKLIEDMVKTVNEGLVEGVSDIRDESARDIAIVVDIKNGHDPEVVAEGLYLQTPLEHTYSINNTCLVDGRPETLSFKDLVLHYIAFQREVLTRRTKFQLGNTVKRLERIAGVLIALNSLDLTIDTIRESGSTQEAKSKLVKKLGISNGQADYILAMQLSRLTRLESKSLKEERQSLEASRKSLLEIVENQGKLDKLLMEELEEISQPFYSQRKTKVLQIDKDKKNDKIKEATVKTLNVGIDYHHNLTIMTDRQFTHEANVKKNRHMFTVDDDKALLVLTTEGVIHRVPLADLESGVSLTRVIDLKPDELILTTLTGLKDEFIILTTEYGMVKKTKLADYLSIKRTNTTAIKLKEGDRVVSAEGFNQEQILLATQCGQLIRFDTKDIRATGRNTLGVKGVDLNESDKVVSATKLYSDEDTLILLTDHGYGQRLPLARIATQGRSGKGNKVQELDNESLLYVVAIGGKEVDTLKIFKGARDEDVAIAQVSKQGFKKLIQGTGITEIYTY